MLQDPGNTNSKGNPEPDHVSTIRYNFIGKFKLKYTDKSGTVSATTCLSHSLSAPELAAKLELLTNLDDVKISRENITSPGNGYLYRITFVGFKVSGDVQPLELDLGTCGQSFASDTNIEVGTLFNGGMLKSGIPYYLRVRAINSIGGRPTLCCNNRPLSSRNHNCSSDSSLSPVRYICKYIRQCK